MAQERKHKVTPRLVNKTEAAYYCGMNTAQFTYKCMVRPINLGGTTLRYDIVALDKWIDDLSLGPNYVSIDETIANMGIKSRAKREARRKRDGSC